MGAGSSGGPPGARDTAHTPSSGTAAPIPRVQPRNPGAGSAGQRRALSPKRVTSGPSATQWPQAVVGPAAAAPTPPSPAAASGAGGPPRAAAGGRAQGTRTGASTTRKPMMSFAMVGKGPLRLAERQRLAVKALSQQPLRMMRNVPPVTNGLVTGPGA